MDPILLDAIEYNGGGINTLLNRGAVKSVQRGYWGDSLNTDTAKTKYIEINAVDPEKCELFAVVSGNEGGSSGAQYMRNPRIGLTLETNRIAVTNHGSDFCSIGVDWQIIEFY